MMHILFAAEVVKQRICNAESITFNRRQSEQLPKLFISVDSLTYDKGYEKGGSCTTCRFLVELLHDLWGDDIVDDCLAELVTYLCTRLDIDDNFICKGITSHYKVIERTYY